MTAFYKISQTPSHLLQLGTPKFYVSFFCGNLPNTEYERRARQFFDTQKAAEAAGKRYLKKMQKAGFEISPT